MDSRQEYLNVVADKLVSVHKEDGLYMALCLLVDAKVSMKDLEECLPIIATKPSAYRWRGWMIVWIANQLKRFGS